MQLVLKKDNILSRFKNIDHKIKNTAKKLNARLSIDRPNYPEQLRTFEERRIDWIENLINKAIIIQPSFTLEGVDSSKWSFINLAWRTKNGIAQKPGYRITLIDKSDFNEIENRIDELLVQSVVNLQTVKLSDIKDK